MLGRGVHVVMGGRCGGGGSLGSVHVGLFLSLRDVFLVANAFVAEPVAHLKAARDTCMINWDMAQLSVKGDRHSTLKRALLSANYGTWSRNVCTVLI